MKIQVIKRDKKRFSQLGSIEEKVLELKTFLKGGRRLHSDTRPWYVALGEDAAVQAWVKSLALKPKWQSVGGSTAAKAEDVNIRAMEQWVLFSVNSTFWQAPPAQESERSSWQSFCHLLNRKRSFKSPQGLVVCVSINSLKNNDGLSHFQSQLKSALNEAAEIYFGKIPVYLVITDLDQVDGFQAYSAKVRPEQKEQVFGFSHPFSKKNQLNEAEALKAIHGQLEAKLLSQLRHDEKKSENVDAFFFPQQLAAFYPAITELCEHITHASPNLHRLILRGVYFTALEERANSAKAGALFAKPILTEVLLKETQAFSTWHQIDEWLSQHRKGLLVGISVGTVALLSIWWLGVLHNESYLNQVNTAVMSMQNIENPLSELEALQQLYEMGEDQSAWMIRFLGVLFPSKVSGATATKYATALQSVFEPMMASSLAAGLANSLTDAKTSGMSDMALLNQDANIYNWLSAYLMLNELDHLDSHTVGNMLSQAWQADPMLSEKVSLYNDLVQFGLVKQTINQELVTQARSILGKQPIDIRAFFALKANANVSPVLLGGKDQSVLLLSSGSSVDGFYTLTASKQFLGSNEESAIKQTLEQSWVLGDQSVVKVDNAAITKLKKSVNQFYWSQYFTTWNKALSGVSFQPFTNLQSTASFLKNANQKNSAFVIFWQDMSNNLTGMANQNIPADKDLSHFANSMNAYLANQSNFNNITVSLNQLGHAISSAGSGEGVVNLSAQILNHQVAALSQLQQLANQAPQPVQNILNSLIKQVVSSVFSNAEEVLRKDWAHSVAGQCRAIVGDSSSFIGASNRNLDLRSFGNFFGNQGVAGQFINTHLVNLVSIQNGVAHSRSAYGVTFRLPGHLQENIGRLLSIRSAFFSYSDSNPSFYLQLTPLFLSKNMADFTVYDAGQSLFYQNGPRISQTLSWPNHSRSVTVKFTGLNGKIWQGTYPGQWGLVKFLNSANSVKVIDATHYQLTFSEQGFSATYEATLQKGNFAGITALRDFSCN